MFLKPQNRKHWRDTIAELIDCQLMACCLNCEFYNKDTAGCGKSNGAVPPPYIALYGCELWEGEVPF